MPEVPGSISGQPSETDKVYKHVAGNKDQVKHILGLLLCQGKAGCIDL